MISLHLSEEEKETVAFRERKKREREKIWFLPGNIWVKKGRKKP